MARCQHPGHDVAGLGIGFQTPAQPDPKVQPLLQGQTQTGQQGALRGAAAGLQAQRVGQAVGRVALHFACVIAADEQVGLLLHIGQAVARAEAQIDIHLLVLALEGHQAQAAMGHRAAFFKRLVAKPAVDATGQPFGAGLGVVASGCQHLGRGWQCGWQCRGRLGSRRGWLRCSRVGDLRAHRALAKQQQQPDRPPGRRPSTSMNLARGH